MTALSIVRRAVVASTLALPLLASSRADAHDAVDLRATRVHASGAGPFAIETALGLVVRPPSDGSAWTLLCTDAAAVGRPLGAALAGGAVVLATEAGLRTYAIDACTSARASVPFDGIGIAFAATASGSGLFALVSDDAKWSSALVSFDAARLERRRSLPTPIAEARLFLLGDVPCASGLGEDALVHVECVDADGWSDRALPLAPGTRAEPVTVAEHAGGHRVLFAVRTPFSEPDRLVISSDRGATLEAPPGALAGLEKVRGAVVHRGTIFVAARAVAGAEAARGTLYTLDLGSGALDAVAKNGPPYECLGADARGLYACVDRAVDPGSATVLASTNSGATWEHVFSFGDLGSIEGCGGAACLSQRAALCVGAGTFCERAPPAEPIADPGGVAPIRDGCAVAGGGGAGGASRALYAVATLVALAARRSRVTATGTPTGRRDASS